MSLLLLLTIFRMYNIGKGHFLGGLDNGIIEINNVLQKRNQQCIEFVVKRINLEERIYKHYYRLH